MKRLVVLLALGAGLGWTQFASAHDSFEIGGAIGYRWGGRISAVPPDGDDASDATLVLEPALSYSAILGYRVKPNGFAFLSFSRSQSSASLRIEDSPRQQLGTLAVEYYQIGGNIETTIRRVVPYFGASVGISRFASVGQNRDRVFFATVFDGGVKFELHEHVHLRLLGRFPIVFTNGELYCESNGACAKLDQFEPFVQGEAQLGLGVSF